MENIGVKYYPDQLDNEELHVMPGHGIFGICSL